MKRPLFASGAIAVAAFACGSNVIPASGLMVVITSDGALGSDFDAIKIQVNGRDVDTSTVTLPTTLGITGAPGSRVLFEARGQKNNVLHVAVLNETTIPSGRVARLDVKLARDCYDRCVQFGPTDTLGDVCDPDTLGSAPSTKTCGPPRPIAVDSLPTYDPSRDPVSNPSAAPPSGCAAPSAYCTSTLGCNDVVGTDKSAGALVCDAACSRVEQTTTCHDASLDPGSVWSTFGGQMSRTQVSRIDGPKTAPETITTAATNFSGAMTISADNTRAFLPLGVFANGATHVAAIDLSTLTPTALLDPSPADLLAALGQKGRLSPWGCSSSPTPDPAFRRSSPVSGLGIGDRRWASYAPYAHLDFGDALDDARRLGASEVRVEDYPARSTVVASLSRLGGAQPGPPALSYPAQDGLGHARVFDPNVVRGRRLYRGADR